MIECVRFPQNLYIMRKKNETSGKVFYVHRPYRIEYKEDGRWISYEVGKGFGSDFASVPRGFRNIVSKLDGVEASVVHDHMGRMKTVPRKKADEIFLVALKASGIPWLRRNLMYSAVSVFTFFRGGDD